MNIAKLLVFGDDVFIVPKKGWSVKPHRSENRALSFWENARSFFCHLSSVIEPRAGDLGTYLAGNNYASYPVLSFDNVVSGITHSISGFCSLYIVISDMTGMRKRNISITISILSVFCVLAYVANRLIPYNNMFLTRGDGTPYDIIYNMVGGNQILYPLLVVLLFYIYIVAFYGVYYLIKKHTHQNRKPNNLK
jgi:hypothetical protein